MYHYVYIMSIRGAQPNPVLMIPIILAILFNIHIHHLYQEITYYKYTISGASDVNAFTRRMLTDAHRNISSLIEANRQLKTRLSASEYRNVYHEHSIQRYLTGNFTTIAFITGRCNNGDIWCDRFVTGREPPRYNLLRHNKIVQCGDLCRNSGDYYSYRVDYIIYTLHPDYMLKKLDKLGLNDASGGCRQYSTKLRESYIPYIRCP